jgi:hypothetical protein
MPLFIDPGVGEYTAKTFSKDRYTIWTMQSQYHNLPQINGQDEKEGRQYAAKVLAHKQGQLTLDIAGAYPSDAAVKSWKRTVKAMKSAISVTEDYQLSDCREPVRLMLITTIKPEISQADGSAVRLGRHSLQFDSRQLSASVEDISRQLDPLLQGMWGPRMFRIVLTVNGTAKNNKISYTIR